MIIQDSLPFTEEDLAANQNGYLTKSQRRRLRFEHRLWIAVGIIVIGFAVLLTAEVANAGLWMDALQQRLLIAALLLAFGLFLIFVWFKQRRLQADLYKGEVAGFEYWLQPSWYITNRGGVRYYVNIKNERIPISHDTYLALSTHDYSHYVYVAAHSKKLLSFEPLLDAD